MSSGSGGDGTDGLASTGKTSSLAMYIGIGLFVGIALLVAFCYVKSLLRNRNQTLPSVSISPDNPENNQSRNHGLDLEHISLLPTFLYQPPKYKCHNKAHEHDHKVISTVDCAVCLGELEEGDTVRVLPSCKHYFHIDCIDMWLSTNSSCPMCRAHPEPDKTKLETVIILPPWNNNGPIRSSSLRQFSFGSCLGSPFVKTPRKSPSSINGASPFHASWQGSPSVFMSGTPPMDLHQILVRARTPER